MNAPAFMGGAARAELGRAQALLLAAEPVAQRVDQGLKADGSAQVLDARPADRFAGTTPEPRPGLRSGRRPGSLNIRASDLVVKGRLKENTALVSVFENAGVDWTKSMIASCGSGVTAAIVVLALETLGRRRTAVYDGSWAEWGARSDLPVTQS